MGDNKGSSALEVAVSFVIGAATGFVLGILFAPPAEERQEQDGLGGNRTRRSAEVKASGDQARRHQAIKGSSKNSQKAAPEVTARETSS
jgi:hypothetical protein